MKKRKNGVIYIIIALMLIVVTFMETWMVFQMTSQQTREAGIFQLQTISGELESTINEAKNRTMQIAIQAKNHMKTRKELGAFILKQKRELLWSRNGGYNVFVAASGWDIIPGLVKSDGYEATERGWYTGAIRSGGATYITSPYVDALTGNICYTVSVELGDGDTVLGVDYTMENIQAHITQMNETVSRDAVIVTADGIIAGCRNEELIGKRLNDTFPDYAGVFALAKGKKGVAFSRVKSGLLYDNLFAGSSGEGWYLIVRIGDLELYKQAYVQLIVTVALCMGLLCIVLVLYFMAVRNQRKALQAQAVKEEFLEGITGKLHEPLRRIMDGSVKEAYATTGDYEGAFTKIHEAGEQLSEMIGQLRSYSSIVRTENKKQIKKKDKAGKIAMNVRFRTVILWMMVFVMLASLYITVSATYREGNVRMKSEADHYEYQLSEWINTQKSILDMFCSILSTHPQMLEDYEGTIKYLNAITKQYPEISASYMTNPELEHTVYMNTGWEPEEDWHVEDRQWYKDTLASESGFSISAPYYDVQTGIYCVTFSERVYDDRTGHFLGNFGIDFYMDKLVEILGTSYSENGYAFLVDAQGDIINHPYGSYQMSMDKSVNVTGLSYGKVKADGKHTMLMRDYDGSLKVLLAARDEASNFKIYVVSNVWNVYGRVMIYGCICLLVFAACIGMVRRQLTQLIRWQDKTNEQMKQAADAAIAAGNAKSQFLAQMSHEIRTPINAVLGMNEMVLRESKEEAIRDYAANIQTAGRTLLSLINSILDFSKIEDGKMEIIPVEYDTAVLVGSLVNTISGRAKQKGLELQVNVDPTLPCRMQGDDVRISQVIMNLLTNAVKYTKEGTVTLDIRDGGRVDGQIELIVEVRDTGIGIRKEDMGRLFESFTRLEEQRNRNIEGTGLGMSIVTKLLEMMGSELQVDSVYGKGSVFSFCLDQDIVDGEPLGDYEERLTQLDRRSEKKQVKISPDARVLVVDDNAMNRKVAQNLLKLCNVVPDLAASGFEAIEKIREKQYHIVFLDHMMPEMDGIETLERLKKEELLKDGTTVIALTANAVVGAREMYLKAGFDDYLSKPIELEKLEKKLRKYVPETIAQ